MPAKRKRTQHRCVTSNGTGPGLDKGGIRLPAVKAVESLGLERG
jgi:hypothetical protein